MPTDPISPWPLVKRSPNRIFPVRSLQQLLRARNHPVTVDGIFGPNTEAAVKAFQQSENLSADGIFGPITDNWVRGFQTAVGTGSDGLVGPITWRALVSGRLSG